VYLVFVDFEDCILYIYTAIQLIEAFLMAGVITYGVYSHRPSISIVGGGLLLGKAVMNILTPEGGSVLKRTIIGYGLGLAFMAVGISMVKAGL
jgi:hypothetical protein